MSDRKWPDRLCDVTILWDNVPEDAAPERQRTVFTITTSKSIANHLKYEMARTGFLELRTDTGKTHLIPVSKILGVTFDNERLAEVIDEETGEVTKPEKETTDE